MSMLYNTKLYTSTEDDNGKPTGIVYNGLEPMPFGDWISTYAKEDREELKKIMEVYTSYGNKSN